MRTEKINFKHTIPVDHRRIMGKGKFFSCWFPTYEDAAHFAGRLCRPSHAELARVEVVGKASGAVAIWWNL